MAEKKYNILKAASWYTIGNILIKGVSFFVLPIFTRLMNTHEYGIYSVYLSYLSIFETVILLGLSSTVVIARYAEEVDFDSYISTVVMVPSAITVLCIGIINIIIPIFGEILSMNATLWNCLLISSAASAIGGIIGARLVIDGRYFLYMVYSGVNTVGNIVISLVLCYTTFKTHDVHLARVYGSTVSAVLSAIIVLLATKTKIAFSRNCIKYAFAWGIPLLFHTVATVVLMQSDRILIRYMDSYSSAGIYAVATTIVTIPMVLQQSLHQAWTPWFYDRLEKSSFERIKWLNNRYIVLYAIIISGFMILVPDVVHLFAEESYWPCIFSLIPLAISVFAELLYSIPTSVEYYYKKTTYIMKATLIAVAVNILLDVGFIKAFGYHGAAYATTLSKIILFLLHLRFSKRLEKNEVFSIRVVGVCVIGLVLINIFSTVFVEKVFLRWLMLAVIVLPAGWYLIKNRDLLMRGFKEED